MDPLHSQLMGTKLYTSNASPEIPLPKKSSPENTAQFLPQKSVLATGLFDDAQIK